MAEELFRNDPETYKAMAVPFKDVDALNSAVTEFMKELGELRKKHKITNLAGIVKGEYIDSEGEPLPFMLPLFFGSVHEEEGMAAYLFGHTQSQRQERIAEMYSSRRWIKKPAPQK